MSAILAYGSTASRFYQNAIGTTAEQAVPANVPWHLTAAYIDAVSVWPDYTGKGVSVGIFDDGIRVSGTELASALVSSTSEAAGSKGQHGTAVAGIIAAPLDGDRPIGVAFGASVTAVDILDVGFSALVTSMARAKDFDVANNSWGWTSDLSANSASLAYKSFYAAITAAADEGRGGLGTVQVVAAGNGKASGGDSNMSNFTSDRHVITVGATTYEGKVASYANGGAAVLVSAPSNGGSRGITTTDLAGSAGYSSGSVTDSFGGTSAATPEVAGVVALMLEANPLLGWRDVKAILALSANQIADTATVTNGATTWNGGGLTFSHDVGYGIVDARAAVRLAETWTVQSTSANEASLSAKSFAAQTLADFGTISYTIEVKGGLDVENAQLRLFGQHDRLADLDVTLTSPDGTVSTLLSQDGKASTAFANWTFGSQAFLGEAAEGIWTVTIRDKAAGSTGQFQGATLDLYGAAPSQDDIYVYTDAFAKLGTGARTVLEDKGGHDSLNASAVSSDLVIKLTAGETSWIAGKALVIAKGTVIESAFGGDGNDRIEGNDANNLIVGGRGNDILIGGAGDDILIGGAGNNDIDGGSGLDLAIVSGNVADWSFSLDHGELKLSSKIGTELDSYVSVERLLFNDKMIAFDIDGAAGTAYRLYEAAFDRTPDSKGLAYWIRQLDGGLSALSIAESFVTSGEFKTKYGSELSNAAFVEKIYENVLGRHPDADGLAYWNSKLTDGSIDRAGALYQFALSTENETKLMGLDSKGIVMAASDWLTA